MTIEQLLKLAQNPYYVLSPKQLKELEYYNNERYRMSKVVKHNTTFQKHNPNLKVEDDRTEVN